jgi:hypothetical protein
MCGSGSCWYQFVVSKLEIWYRFYSRDICAAIFPSSQTYMMRIVSIAFESNTFSELSQKREAKSSTGCCFEFGSQKFIVYWFWKKMREIWPTPSVPHLLCHQCPFFKSQFFRWKHGLKRLRIHGGSSPSIQSSSVPPAKLRMACTSIETSAANVTPIIAGCTFHNPQSATGKNQATPSTPIMLRGMRKRWAADPQARPVLRLFYSSEISMPLCHLIFRSKGHHCRLCADRIINHHSQMQTWGYRIQQKVRARSMQLRFQYFAFGLRWMAVRWEAILLLLKKHHLWFLSAFLSLMSKLSWKATTQVTWIFMDILIISYNLTQTNLHGMYMYLGSNQAKNLSSQRMNSLFYQSEEWMQQTKRRKRIRASIIHHTVHRALPSISRYRYTNWQGRIAAVSLRRLPTET